MPQRPMNKPRAGYAGQAGPTTQTVSESTNRPLAQELVERVTRLSDAFRRVVFRAAKLWLHDEKGTSMALPAVGGNGAGRVVPTKIAK